MFTQFLAKEKRKENFAEFHLGVVIQEKLPAEVKH